MQQSQSKNALHRQRGFTLIELTVVLMILVALAGILIPTLSGYVTRSHAAAASTNIGEINKFVQLYHTKYLKGWGAGYDSLLTPTNTFYPGLPSELTGGLLTITALDSAQADSLTESGITAMANMVSAIPSGGSATYNANTELPAAEFTPIADAVQVAFLADAQVRQSFGLSAAQVAEENYVVFGLGQRNSLIGKVMTDAPLHFDEADPKEVFGHVKGAFTGALRDRAGRFELADGGTLFLDEVGEIPIDLQAKLLRVLQEGELERIGEERTRKVDVRIIAATNRDLRAEAEAGRFRQDLYYRFSVFPMEVPALRKRKEDIPVLAEHFLEQFTRKMGRSKPRLTMTVVQRLQQYDWPGNVRELQHVLERALIIGDEGRLPIELPQAAPSPLKKIAAVAAPDPATPVLTDAQFRELEAQNIRAALASTKGKVSGPGGAAELLGMKATTLASRIKVLNIS